MKTKMAGLMVVGSVLGVFLAACCGGAGSKIKEAESATAEGRYDDAIAIYEQVLVEHPDSEEAALVPKAIEDTMLAKASSLDIGGRYDEAIDVYEELASRRPDGEGAAKAQSTLPKIEMKRAEQFAAAGNRRGALAAYETIQERWPDSPEATLAGSAAGDLRCDGGTWGVWMGGRFVSDNGSEDECNARVRSIYAYGAALGVGGSSRPPKCTCHR